MLKVAVIILFLIKAVLPVPGFRATPNKNLRLCVSNKQSTDHIKNSCVVLKIENSGVECVDGIDGQDCLQRIRHGTADFGVFSPEDLVSSQSGEDAVVIAEIRTRDRTFQRYTVAVVGQKVLADRSAKLHAVLKDRALCHPGTDVDDSGAFSRTLSGYLEFLVQPSDCSNDENRIKTLAEYFGRSCRAGPWVTDVDLDMKLKRQYSSLCAACGSGTCSAKDRYWGALGALACVVEVGEVAWAELDDVKSFFGGSFFGLKPMRGRFVNPESYSLLCPDYTSQAIANASESCVWLHQPWPVIVTRIVRFLDVDKLIKSLTSSESDYRESALAAVLGTRTRALTPLQYPAYTLDYLARARGFLDAYSVQPCEEDLPRDMFKCIDGQQISLSKLCNGAEDCRDGSDETAEACLNNSCGPYQFRCAYGGCIAAAGRCDGIQDCVDISDESSMECTKPEYDNTFPSALSVALASLNQPPDPYIFRCADRQQIPQSGYCDGFIDCEDGSDETASTCRTVTCEENQFQCAYGACVDIRAKCNGKQDCADGSDESDVCKNPEKAVPIVLSRFGEQTLSIPSTNRSLDVENTSPISSTNRSLDVENTSPISSTNRPVSSGLCILPPYPARGTYIVKNFPKGVPGQKFSSVQYTVFCHYGFGINGNRERTCVNGDWSKDVGPCLRNCRLDIDSGQITYTCHKGKTAWPCSRWEPHGTLATPECSRGYYAPVFSPMLCEHGLWNYTPTCRPDCGLLEETENENTDLPWQALIYKKTNPTYRHRCGGTLVSSVIVLSAAHCFVSPSPEEEVEPASDFAVAVGKLYRDWDFVEGHQQTSDVLAIEIPDKDLAILILRSYVKYNSYVKPVCLSQDVISTVFLKKGKIGKFAAFWGSKRRRPRIATLDFTHIATQDCVGLIQPKNLNETLDENKFCTDAANSYLCTGDTGSGIVFPDVVNGVKRYYLVGVALSAQRIVEDYPCGKSPVVFSRLDDTIIKKALEN